VASHKLSVSFDDGTGTLKVLHACSTPIQPPELDSPVNVTTTVDVTLPEAVLQTLKNTLAGILEANRVAVAKQSAIAASKHLTFAHTIPAERGKKAETVALSSEATKG
jgi:hypothetical protein